MSSTYSQIYIQIVFAVKGRENLISKKWCGDLHKYISGIITNKGHKAIIVNGVADHVHIFVGLKPKESISDLVRDVKSSSAKFINDNRYVRGRFSWQEGYGAFSYAQFQIEKVYNYILNQEEHHKKRTFREEYISFLNKFQIDYNEKFLFEWIK